MTKVVEGVLSIVKGLRPRDRRDFVKGLISAGILTRDEQDAAVIESRRGGRTRSLKRLVTTLKKEGRLD